MKEVWQPVPGYEGLYEVSDQGRVRSLDRSFERKTGPRPATIRLKGRMLKPGLASNGYLTVSLWAKNKGRSHCIHVLVMNAFVCDSAGFDINHIDGDKNNNRLENLEICTRSENMRHAVRLGLWANGSTARLRPRAAA